MSEKLFRFVLSELTTVRVKCAACQAVAEVSIGELDTRFQKGRCPFCDALLQNPVANNLAKLAAAIRELKTSSDAGRFEIEFTIPDKSGGTGP